MRLVNAVVIVLVSTLTVAACTDEAPGSHGPTAGPVRPGPVDQEQKTLTVKKRNLTVRYKLQGSSVASDHVGLPTPDNTRFDAGVQAGGDVRSSMRIGRLVPDSGTLAALRRAASTSTVARSQLTALTQRAGDVVAPVDGKFAASGSRRLIQSSGLDAVVPITPLQELRYRSFQFNGTVTLETVFGQRTARCVAVWLEAGVAGAAGQAEQQPGQGQLHCRIPADVESAAGLPLTVTLTARTLPGVLAIPAIYVGLDRDGKNYIVKARRGGEWTDIPVVVGPSDGVVRVIVSGITEADVLAPVTDS